MPGARAELKWTPWAASDCAFLICHVKVSDAVTAGSAVLRGANQLDIRGLV